MSNTSGKWKNRLLNGGILLGSLCVALLLYAFVAGSLVPEKEMSFDEPSPEYDGSLIQVEVVNGCGVAGVAERTRAYLIDRHFDVISVGNHDHYNVPHTLVVDRIGDMEAARRVADALGVPPDRIKQEIRPEYYLDASIILGNDYAALAPFDGEPL